MTTNDIRNRFLNNKITSLTSSVDSISEIAKYVTVKTRMTEEKMDYYIEININDLSKSDIENDILDNMVNEGWYLSKDKQKLIKNL